MPDAILDQGIVIIQALQGLGDWLQAPMFFFTTLGNELFYILALPVLYWCVNLELGLRVGIALMVSSALNGLLKLWFGEPRPYWYSPVVRALSAESYYGLPSGHAQNAVVVWGMLAAFVRRRWMWVSAVALMILIGVSRVYLAVHFPSDVVGGWLIGLVILATLLRFEPPVLTWFRSMGVRRRILLLLLATVSLVVVGGLAADRVGPLPPDWVQNAMQVFPEEAPIQPFSLDGVITAAGVLFGLVTGAVLMEEAGGFSPFGPLRMRTARYLIGIGGLLIVWAGLGAWFPDGGSAWAYVLRFVRYSLVGLWVMYIGPIVFVRLGVASRPANGER